MSFVYRIFSKDGALFIGVLQTILSMQLMFVR